MLAREVLSVFCKQAMARHPIVVHLLPVFVIVLVFLVVYMVPKMPEDSFAEIGDPIRVAPVQDGSNRNFSIPHILHQTFASELVYENYKPFINSCLSLNPDWTYYLWRDSDAEALLSEHYPQYLSTYKDFSDNLQRSDAIRYVILHKFGGIYLDMDVKCLKPFHPTLTSHAAFLDQERVEQTRILWSQEFMAMNSLMGSVPGHLFFQVLSDRVLTRKLPGNAFYSTGPKVLTSVFKWHQESPAARRWPVTLLPPSVGSPLMDPDKDWKARCRNAKKIGADSPLGWLDRGCRMLEAKQWQLDDTNDRTVAVHHFLHLGYDFSAYHRRTLFNMTQLFGLRLQFYNSNSVSSH